MAKRYYLVTLSRVFDEDEGAYMIRTPLDGQGVNAVYLHPPTDPQTGEPTRPVALALVEAVNHARLMALPGVDPLPDFPLDGKINAMRSDTLAGIQNRIRARGLAVTWSNSDGYRDMVRGVGRQIEPAFHEDNFDVSA